MDIRRLLRSDLDDLEDYVPVKPLDVLAEEIGMPIRSLVKLDANENLYGAPPQVFDAIRQADLHIYPDPGQTALRAAIAEYVQCSPDQVVAGTGADDLIDIIIRLALPESVAILTPTFGMYRFLARISRVRPVEVPRGKRFEVDIEGTRRAVEAGAGIVFATSPNNPTGNCLTNDEVEALCQLDALIVVDEAYVEFGGTSLVPSIARHPNLIILRTFSKWAGLAGLRVGYAIADTELAGLMMAIKQPYNVNIAADLAARAAIEHRAAIFETVRCITAERDRMSQLAAAFGWLRPLPSESNFVLFEVSGRSARDVAASLRRRGVLVRYYERPDLENYIRISAGRPEDTDRLIEALKEVENE
ncbi:MAG: histidinol-phosphate transaminase [Dehalococcoidia bacterium]|nr:histidinol-phosphate transaminase [Dehalococcoidia bacterium]